MRNLVKFLSYKSEIVLLICEDVRDRKKVARDVRTDAEALKEGNSKLKGMIQKLENSRSVDQAREQTLVGIADFLRSMLVDSRVECANFRWNAQTVVWNT